MIYELIDTDPKILYNIALLITEATLMTAKDITGQEIKVNDIVLTTESNRLIQARVLKINPRSNNCTLEPLMSTTGGRRRPPILRKLVRQEHNVYVLKEGEILFQQLRGFYHNTGEHPIRQPKLKGKKPKDPNAWVNSLFDIPS